MKWRPVAMLGAYVVSTAVAGLFAVAVAAQQSPQELTGSQVESIKNNCVTAQVSLQRLRDSDLTARTIRGRSYNDINLLIKAFNSRVVFNGINAPNLIAVPTALDSNYTNFYNHYTAYASSLREALIADCESQPERFYSLFLRVEQHRETLAKDVSIMNDLIEEYEDGVLSLKASLSSSGSKPEDD
jgi:hypothetical protein